MIKAFTAQILLSRRGVVSDLRIGVAKNERGRLEAHAWVECRGRIVVGDSVDLAGLSAMQPMRMGED